MKINERVPVPLSKADEREVDSWCEFYTRKYRGLTRHADLRDVKRDIIR